MEHTKSRIKKLGSDIRKEYRENGEISDEFLNILHDYRISFKEPMSKIFDIVTFESKNIRKGDVRTYRIKRIESIISKLNREKSMGLLEMGDIAGCRVIVSSQRHVEKLVHAIEKRLQVVDRNDYISTPRSSGYKSYHLMINPEEQDNFKRLVEIQIRTNEHHNWATLVEITDQLFKIKVKEGEHHSKLERFHFLRSFQLSDLSLSEMKEIIDIEKEFEIHQKVIKVIIKNYIKIRSAWMRLDINKNHEYFILEIDDKFQTHIETFSNFEEAEKAYLKKYIKTENNVVLTHIDSVNFKKLSKAYSNYVLTFHKFEEEIFHIIHELLLAESFNKDKESFNYYRNYAKQLARNTNRYFSYSIGKIKSTNYKGERTKEWVDELGERIELIQTKLDEILSIERKRTFYEKIFK